MALVRLLVNLTRMARPDRQRRHSGGRCSSATRPEISRVPDWDVPRLGLPHVRLMYAITRIQVQSGGVPSRLQSSRQTKSLFSPVGFAIITRSFQASTEMSIMPAARVRVRDVRDVR